MTDNYESMLTHTEHIFSQKKNVTRVSLHADNHNILAPAKFGKNKKTAIANSENFFVKTSLHEQRKDSHVMIISNRGDHDNC